MMYKRKENGEQINVIKSMQELGCSVIDLIPFNYKSLHMSNESIIEEYERNNNVIIENNFKLCVLKDLDEKRQEVLSLALKILVGASEQGGAECTQ